MVATNPSLSRLRSNRSLRSCSLWIGSATICDSLIDQADIDCAPAGILGDHGLEHDQSQTGLDGFLNLHPIERELPGCLAPWIAQRDPGVGSRHVEMVCLSEITIEIDRQPGSREAIMILADLGEDFCRARRAFAGSK